MLYEPQIFRLSCDDCERFVAEVDGSRITGKLCERLGKLIPRPPGNKPPCPICPKCEGLPASQCNPTNGRKADLSEKNLATIELYYQAQALPGCFADADGITRQNFAIIRRKLDSYDRRDAQSVSALIRVLGSRSV